MNTPDPSWASWCEVSADALRHNLRAFRARIGAATRLGVVVKSDGYGHGAALVSEVLVGEGVDWLVVNTAAEALALRGHGVAVPLYICGPVLPAQAAQVVEARARVVVAELSLLEALSVAGQSAGWIVPVHIKIETGTHRQGLEIPEALALGRRASSAEGVHLEGLATHYADIEDTTDHRWALGQLSRFGEAVQAFRDAGMAPEMAHSANSAATILYPETHGDLVRVGIAAYGLWPSSETLATAIQMRGQGPGGFTSELRPVLSWRARVAQIKDVPEGGFIGYGRTYRATHRCRVAVLPVGYFEGYDRRLSGVAHVLVGGRRAPVRGRVCMNMCMVDVTHVPDVEIGTVATLLGEDGEERITADQLAGWMGSIGYEVVSRIAAGQPRMLAD